MNTPILAGQAFTSIGDDTTVSDRKNEAMPIRNWKATPNRFMIEFPEPMAETL
jgi:hypothetical protein